MIHSNEVSLWLVVSTPLQNRTLAENDHQCRRRHHHHHHDVHSHRHSQRHQSLLSLSHSFHYMLLDCFFTSFHFVSFHLDLYLPPRSRSRNLGCQIDGERNSVHDSVRRPMVLFEFVFFGSSPRFSQLALLYLPVLRIQVPQQILSFAGIS